MPQIVLRPHPNLTQNNGHPVPRFAQFNGARLKLGAEAQPARDAIAQALFDFDGTLLKTEYLRQLGWLLTALKPQYVGYFGGEHALKEYAAACKSKGTGPFQDAIGAAEDEHARIIDEVALKCIQKANSTHSNRGNNVSQQGQLDINEFRNARNKLVNDLMQRQSFAPNIGMWETFSLLQNRNIPLMIVTQSRRATVIEALKLAADSTKNGSAEWKKLCGENFEKILMVCFDDLQKYGLQKKPSPQPYRFATCLVALMQSREKDKLEKPISAIKPTEEEFRIAASLAMYTPSSEEFKAEVVSLLDPARARIFLKNLPDPKRVFVIEDTTTGLESGQEFTTVFVENGVGASRAGRPFTQIPVLQSAQQLDDSRRNLVALASKKARIDYATLNLLGVSDLFRAGSI